ncbi:MAG: GMC family oxidoreductase [Ilumatobacteraceae bacterium]|nr:GMC family oxidoreductase [Ilumatobacteraceae bacterium]
MSAQAATTPATTPATTTMDADVLIIGSGAGGATTAAVLAEAGLDVLIVEEGEWVEQGAVVPFSLEQMDRQYRAGGVTVALGLPAIAYTEGRCAGGGTEVNSGLYWRPPGDVLQRWRDEFRIADFDPDEVLSIADEVERDISVSTVPGPYTEPSDVLRRGADALGWRNGEIPRWMTYPAHAPGGERQSMTLTYLPRAMRAGARMATGCRIDRLVRSGATAISADTTLADGRRGSITFRTVFVCGGAIQSPALLQRSGVRGHIGKTLAVHPTVKLAARFADELNVPDDVPVHQVKEFAPHLSFGGSASNPGLVALSLLDQWSTFQHAITEWRKISVYYAAITSEGLGRVRSFPRMKDPVVTYGLTHRDRELLRSGLGRLALLMLEAGAVEVYPSFKGAPSVKNRRDLATMQHAFAATKASVMTVHLCSTVPMGELEGRTGADSCGLVHGCKNIYVNDASLLPTAPGVNPPASVMAFAIRNARRFVASGGRRA